MKKYEEVYEPLKDRNVHYIKLIDMVTGRGHMDVSPEAAALNPRQREDTGVNSCEILRCWSPSFIDQVNRISGYIPGKIVFFLMQVGEGDEEPSEIQIGCRVGPWKL